jgi:N-acetylglucosamine-6-phosphate deacetylase
VNGYAGVDFNQEELTAGELHQACEGLERDGVEGILATLITAPLDLMEKRLRRLRSLREADPLASRLIEGFHLEGPFINPEPGYRGAHQKEYILPAREEGMKRLLDAAGGLCSLVTLAPEHDEGHRVIRLLVRGRVKVSAGHCNPSAGELERAADEGLSLFTHLGNGCPPTLPRHDNIIQRVLSLSHRIRPCFIADGVHIPFRALGNYLRAAGTDRAVVVTDAMAAAGKGAGRYKLGGRTVDVGEDLAVWDPDDPTHLMGSAVTLARSAENLRSRLGLGEGDIDRLMGENPRTAISS